MASPVACTVVARNYLPAARVLARSYLEHNPGHLFVVAVIDAGRGEQPDGFPDERCRIVGPDAFGIDEDEYLRMATAYTVMELATAVKPYLLRSLRTEHEVAIYLDPDIQVFAPMPEVEELARAHQVVLTPHFLRPLPRDGKEPGEAVIMGTGMFNLGFLAVGPGSEEFLDFWAHRLRLDAVIAPDEQLFTDQRWVDQVPSLYRHHVLRDPGFNVAYWNTHERPIGRDARDNRTAGGHSLRFFHFSGYRPDKPWLLTYHCARSPRTLLSEHPELRALCDAYGAALRDAGYQRTDDENGYGFGTLPDGTRLTPLIRRLFRTAWIDFEREDPGNHGRPKEKPPAHGFGPDGGAELISWLSSALTPAHAAAGISRLALAIWGSRADLRAAFPDPAGADAAGFRRWCRESGPHEVALPRWACPDEPAELSEPDGEFGVNIVGYLTAELGLGEMGRTVHDAIADAGVPLTSIVEDRALNNRTGLDSPHTVGTPRFSISLLCVNADQTTVVLDNHPEAGRNRYRIGLWAWELEDFPQWLHPAFDAVDEVWTVSEFCRDAIARHSPVPVRTIPVPVRDPGRTAARRRAGEPIQFLFAFDFNSVGERKNPWGLVEAFRRAFADRDDARLVLKSINSELNPHAAERLRLMIDGDPRIELIDRYVDVAELRRLYAESHCYVSLHRSEGFGLTVAEAMARGMPVIATDYSGTAEFLDERTAWPVPYRMVEVGHGCYPYQADAIWAEPDLDTAARAMRQVADDPDEAARRGWAAREYILSERSMPAASAWLAERLREAYQVWQQRGASGERNDADLDGSHPETAHPGTGHPGTGHPGTGHPGTGHPGTGPPETGQPESAERDAAQWEPEGDATGAEPEPDPPVPEPLDPLRIAKETLHQRPEPGAPSRNPLAPALRKMMLRGLDHYDAHQRAVLAALADGAESTALRLRERIELLERRIESLERNGRLDDLESAIGGLRAKEPETERALRELASGTDSAVAHLADRLDELRHQANVGREQTFDMFLERDRRADATDDNLERLALTTYRVAAQRHAPVPAGAEVALCDAGALLVPRDGVFLPWLLQHRSWENDEAELMTTLAGDGVFVDIGAHAGYHTLRLVRDCPDVAGIVAVEANPDTALLLERNIAANLPPRAADKITVLRLAAWDSETSVRLLQQEPDNSGDYRVCTDAGQGVTVCAARLDGVPEVRDHRVSLIKTDLQGRDHRAIAGLTGVLGRDRPQVICEFSPGYIAALGDDPAQVLRGYRELGYRPVPVTGDGPDQGEHEDGALIAMAQRARGEFSTLWLRPEPVSGRPV
ncbi:MAG: FkbM family methyltransferase [Pseudonocardiaceae bacterium]|nr:FkbM family methyltransferase [Pseudonocardiaceae bacterium]